LTTAVGEANEGEGDAELDADEAEGGDCIDEVEETEGIVI